MFILKREIIKKYITNLKEPYRTVIEMREIDRMSYKDIADTLQKNLSTVKSQIRNGRHLLIEQPKENLKR
jgi:DNA-directed RNA polymerase specialized sigma24 family protein